MTRIAAGRLESTLQSDRHAVDAFFMGRALALAWQGAGKTQTNPLVGAVVVRDGNVVGEGYHERFGEKHAEVIALENASALAENATLYVTLEPCTHQGKTPPCVERILASRVGRVVVAALDPNPRVKGRGIESLRNSGTPVETGCEIDRALLQNLAYFKTALGMGSTVTVKMAVTLDGRIASRRGERDQISGPDAQKFVHRLRAEHDAVMVGINTLLVDRPRLDCRRLDSVVVPTPIVVDPRLEFPLDHPWCVQRREFVLLVGEDAAVRAAGNVAALTERGGRVIVVPTKQGRIDLENALEQVGDIGISSVLVEGGAKVFTSFQEHDLWDAMIVTVSPKMFGPQGVELSMAPVDGSAATLVDAGTLGPDAMVTYLNNRTHKRLREQLV